MFHLVAFKESGQDLFSSYVCLKCSFLPCTWLARYIRKFFTLCFGDKPQLEFRLKSRLGGDVETHFEIAAFGEAVCA